MPQVAQYAFRFSPFAKISTALVRTFPLTKHKTWSHSCMGEFVHEAYHPQGLREYDRDKCYGKKQTCPFRCVVSFAAQADGLAVPAPLNAVLQRICSQMGGWAVARRWVGTTALINGRLAAMNGRRGGPGDYWMRVRLGDRRDADCIVGIPVRLHGRLAASSHRRALLIRCRIQPASAPVSRPVRRRRWSTAARANA